MKVSNVPTDAVITMQKVGEGASPAVTLDSDRNAVIRMSELKTLRFTITYNGDTFVKDISLERLKLEAAPAEESNAEETNNEESNTEEEIAG